MTSLGVYKRNMRPNPTILNVGTLSDTGLQNYLWFLRVDHMESGNTTDSQDSEGGVAVFVLGDGWTQSWATYAAAGIAGADTDSWFLNPLLAEALGRQWPMESFVRPAGWDVAVNYMANFLASGNITVGYLGLSFHAGAMSRVNRTQQEYLLETYTPMYAGKLGAWIRGMRDTGHYGDHVPDPFAEDTGSAEQGGGRLGGGGRGGVIGRSVGGGRGAFSQYMTQRRDDANVRDVISDMDSPNAQAVWRTQLFACIKWRRSRFNNTDFSTIQSWIFTRKHTHPDGGGGAGGPGPYCITKEEIVTWIMDGGSFNGRYGVNISCVNWWEHICNLRASAPDNVY